MPKPKQSYELEELALVTSGSARVFRVTTPRGTTIKKLAQKYQQDYPTHQVTDIRYIYTDEHTGQRTYIIRYYEIGESNG